MKKFIALLTVIALLCTCPAATAALASEAVTTDYGTIPAEYADASQYPVAVFKSDKSFFKGVSSFADNTGSCGMYWIRSDYGSNQGKYLLLRRDLSTVSYPNINHHYNQANIIDLGGNTLTITSSYLFDIYQRFAKNVNITIKNGTIVYPDKIFTHTNSGSYDGSAEFNFTFDNVTFKLAEGSTSASIIGEGASGTETLTENIVFNNCTFDLTDKDDTVATTVFDLGSSSVTSKVTVIGGKFITDTEVVPYSINNDNSSISFDANENGDYIKIAVPQGVDLSSLTLPSGKNIIAYNGATETDGDYTVYVGVMVKEDIETLYGTIPGEYASTADYPVVVFKSDNSFFKAVSSFADGTASCGMYWIRSDNSGNQGKYLLLRDDITMGSYSNMNYHYNQANIIDLGGNTLTVTSEYMLSAVQRFAKDVNITFRNGTIVYPDKIIAYNDSSSYTGTAKFNFTFENVTFKLSDGSASASALVAGKADEDGISGDIILDNCTFDLTRKDASAETTVFNLGIPAVTNSITVKGGSLITNSSKVVPFAAGDGDSAIIFTPDDEGEYFTMAYPADADVLNTEFPVEGGVRYATVASSDANYNYYELTTEPDRSIKTEYGTIPAEYADASQYPVVVFKSDKSFFKATTTFADTTGSCGMYWIRSDYSSNQGKYLLLRADAEMDYYPNTNIHYNQENIIDLGGNTLTVTADHMLRVYQRYDKNVNLIFKNGTIVYSGEIFAHDDSLDYSGTAKFNFTFENITFKPAAGSVSQSLITDGLSGGDTLTDNITLKNCTFDLRARDASVLTTLFSAGSDAVTSVITVQGGQIIADSLELVKIANENSDASSVTFVKDDNGNYTTLKLLSSASICNEVVTTDSGDAGFVAATVDEDYTVYSLSNDYNAEPSIMADKVTIYAVNINKAYNVYAAVYTGDKLTDCEVIPVSEDMRISVSSMELASDGCDTMKVFLWEGAKPVCEEADVNIK